MLEFISDSERFYFFLLCYVYEQTVWDACAIKKDILACCWNLSHNHLSLKATFFPPAMCSLRGPVPDVSHSCLRWWPAVHCTMQIATGKPADLTKSPGRICIWREKIDSGNIHT